MDGHKFQTIKYLLKRKLKIETSFFTTTKKAQKRRRGLKLKMEKIYQWQQMHQLYGDQYNPIGAITIKYIL